MPTPQSDSFCPLQNIRGHELFLWQDLRYSPGHPMKDEQGLRIDEGTWNRLLEGLPTLIGVAKTDGGRSDFVFDEDAGFLFTGPFELTAWRNGRPDERETKQLACRMQYIRFNRPAPPRHGRSPKPCPFCWSRWILLGQLAWLQSQELPLDEFMQRIATTLGAPGAVALDRESAGRAEEPTGPPPAPGPAPPVSAPDALFERLSCLIQWRTAGHLSESEFNLAKFQLGLH